MLAIVLSCDRYHRCAEHMIRCYRDLWPDHPFKFRVPYQNTHGHCQGVEYVRTPLAIKPTVLALLEDLHDEEWIYWAIDDKYAMRLAINKVRHIAKWVESDPSGVDSLLFCRSRHLEGSRNLTGVRTYCTGVEWLERANYRQFWIHQFMRAKVVRHLFNAFPDEIAQPKLMDALMVQMPKPPEHRLFVSSSNFAIFGESTHRGELTKNCRESLITKGMALPTWALDQNPAPRIIIGERPTLMATASSWLHQTVRSVKSYSGRLRTRRTLDDSRPAVVVASLGRSGSTMLARACASRLERTIKPAWSLNLASFQRGCVYKTHDYPSKCVAPPQFARFLYTYADPIDVVISLAKQRKTLGLAWMEKHADHMKATSTDFDRLYDEDIFGLARHFDAWIGCTSLPLIAIRYDRLWEHRGLISEFLRLNLRLPRYSARNSSGLDIPRRKIETIHRTYAGLKQKIATRPIYVSPLAEAILSRSRQPIAGEGLP